LLRLDVELGTRGYPLTPLAFRDLVLNAGGEDWKLGVDFASDGAGSTGGATSGRGPGRPLVGLVSGISSADIPSTPESGARCVADRVEDLGSTGTASRVVLTVGTASSSKSD
jgi:hypothetical protein